VRRARPTLRASRSGGGLPGPAPLPVPVPLPVIGPFPGPGLVPVPGPPGRELAPPTGPVRCVPGWLSLPPGFTKGPGGFAGVPNPGVEPAAPTFWSMLLGPFDAEPPGVTVPRPAPLGFWMGTLRPSGRVSMPGPVPRPAPLSLLPGPCVIPPGPLPVLPTLTRVLVFALRRLTWVPGPWARLPVLTDLPMRGLRIVLLVTLVVPALTRRLVVELNCRVVLVLPVLTRRETVVVRRALTVCVAGRPTRTRHCAAAADCVATAAEVPTAAAGGGHRLVTCFKHHQATRDQRQRAGRDDRSNPFHDEALQLTLKPPRS